MTSAEHRSNLPAWPEARQFRSSIRTEFSLLVAGMMVVLMVAFGWAITDRYVTTVTLHVAKSLLVQARAFSGTAGNHIISATGSDKLMLSNICTKLRADNPDIYWAGIAGRDGAFIAHSDMGQVIAGATLHPVAGAANSEILMPGEAMALQGDTVYIQIPIEEDGISLGRLGIASSSRAIEEARSTSIFTVVVVTGLMMLVGIPLMIVRLRRKLRPLSQIARSLHDVNVEHTSVDIAYHGSNEIGYLAESLRVMGARLQAAQRELLQKERLAQELLIAHDIQTSILPREYPASKRFEFAGAYQSAQEVGGDYYDFVELDDTHLGFIVADVSGKSLPGMLVMLMTRDIVTKLAHTVRQPAEMLMAVNRELHPNIREGMFVTMLYGVLNRHTGHCTFASAGHNSVIVLDGSTGVARTVKTRGFPLGLVDSETFARRIESTNLDLRPGDWLVAYTDGITEAQNDAGEQFGMARFMEVIQATHQDSAQGLVRATMGRLQLFVAGASQYDDITILGLKWTGAAAATAAAPMGDVVYAKR